MSLDDLQQAATAVIGRMPHSVQGQQNDERIAESFRAYREYVEERLKPCYGFLSEEASGGSSITTALNTWVTWQGGTLDDDDLESLGMTAGVLKVTAGGLFLLMTMFSLANLSTAATILGSPFVNGSEIPTLGFRHLGGSSPEMMGSSGMVRLNEGDTLDYRMQKNAAGTLTLYKGSLALVKVAP